MVGTAVNQSVGQSNKHHTKTEANQSVHGMRMQ